MAIAFVQSLFQGSSKTSGTSLVLSGSKTVTTGNTIVVAVGILEIAGPYSVSDNLGNTYALVINNNFGGGLGARLYSAPITAGGTLTSITINHPILGTRAAISVQFSGMGATNGTGTWGASQALTNMYPGIDAASTTPQIVGDLWLGVTAWSGPVGDGYSVDSTSANSVAAIEPTVEQGTTGGSATSNISVGFQYFINNSISSSRLLGAIGTSRGFSTAGADISPAASALAPPPPSQLVSLQPYFA